MLQAPAMANKIGNLLMDREQVFHLQETTPDSGPRGGAWLGLWKEITETTGKDHSLIDLQSLKDRVSPKALFKSAVSLCKSMLMDTITHPLHPSSMTPEILPQISLRDIPTSS